MLASPPCRFGGPAKSPGRNYLLTRQLGGIAVEHMKHARIGSADNGGLQMYDSFMLIEDAKMRGLRKKVDGVMNKSALRNRIIKNSTTDGGKILLGELKGMSKLYKM